MSKKTHAAQRGTARTNRPERRQVEMRMLSLDQWLSADHRARTVWAYVESLDLSELYGEIRSVAGQPGRNSVDPRIPFALWLLATLEGIASSRRLADLTERDVAYMWICGGVSVNHNLLSQFRVEHGELLERLLIDSIAVLMHKNLVTLDEVTQDGMKVRANAGSSSFRREPTLEDLLDQARSHVEGLGQDDSGQLSARQQAAQKRAAKDKQQRVEQAIDEIEKIKSQREQSRSKSKSEPRASTTDPEARTMKMGDKGFRPAFNVQISNDSQSNMVIGVEVTNQGTDSGLMKPMHDKIKEDYEATPSKYYVDGRFIKNDDVTDLAKSGTAVYGPVYQEQKQLDAGKDPYARKRDDSDQMAEFRQRMGTSAAKEEYKKRSLAEFPHADCRNRGLHQFSVRGLIKAKAQVLWHVLAFNFLRMNNLGYLEAVMEG